MEITKGEVKNLKKLKDKKYRKQENLFLVEGVKLVDELINSNFEIKYTISSSEKYKNYPNFKLVAFEVLQAISTTVTSQEVMAVAVIPTPNNNFPTGNSLILDELQDPGNIGTLIRSAMAFNFEDIYFINCPDIYSEKVIRGTMGAIFKVNAHIVTREYINTYKDKICDKLISTDLKAKELSLNSNDKRIAIVIGNEGKGVSEELKNLADINVKLKMSDKIESLNAGVAGSILMYNIFNR